ncbi:MAG: ABC transporter ATP-binding protein [Lachnospiraceae bacterium]|nr:ABC transporter ATP-binding protein [Lachnospiraceae bacterium]
MSAISVKDLTKSYGDHEAVKGISFNVEEGELFAFLGENGAGKSTTINILCTILKKSGGAISILGKDLDSNEGFVRDNIGIVFQNSVLDQKLTVKENLMTRGSYYGYGKKQIMENLSDIMESFGLDEMWDQRYESLSGGQRRRVDIARALINKPKILFLDEPTTGLDPKSRMVLWNYIDHIRQNDSMTIFLTTHYMEETADADHVVILDKGVIKAEGTPAELKSRYASNHLLWYAKNNEENEKRIRETEYRYVADHYDICHSGNITELLYKNRDVMTDYEVLKGTMDDVFLKLTGKELAYE